MVLQVHVIFVKRQIGLISFTPKRVSV